MKLYNFPSDPHARWGMNFIPEGKLIGCDTETTGLSIHKGHKIFLHTFANEQGICSVVPEIPENRAMLKKFYADKTIAKTYHNKRFDKRFLRKHGYDLRGLQFCTLLMSRQHDQYKVSHKLKQLSMRFFEDWENDEEQSVDAWFKEQGIKTNDDKDYSTVPKTIMYPYAAIDAWLALKVLYVLKPFFKEKSQKALFLEEMKLDDICMDMEDRGMLVDHKYLRKTASKIRKKKEALRKETNVLAECAIDINKDKDIAWALFKAGGRCKVYTEPDKHGKGGGNPSFNKHALPNYKYPFIKGILKQRKMKSVLEYMDGMLKAKDKKHVIHSNFNLSLAITGRFSSSGPNLQNPMNIEFIRKGFICRPNMINFYIDFRKIEPRIASHYLGIAELIDGFNNDDAYDPYRPIAEQTGVAYKQSKIVWLALLYGAGKRSVKKVVHCDDYEAMEIIEAFNGAMPEMAELKAMLMEDLKMNGYVEDFFGRQYPAPRDHGFKLLNLLIQGSACGVLKKAMLKIDKILKASRSNLLQLIHDEVVIEFHVDELHLVQKVIDAMEIDLGFKVPMRVKAEYTTDNWANKKNWEGAL